MPAPPPKRDELRETPNSMCHQISRLFHAKMREGSNTADGVMSQPGARHVLSVLAVYDGITQLDIVNHTNLRPPTVSVILKKMEEQGMVERVSNPKDMREIQVYLTEYGRKIDQDNIARIKEVDRIALAGLEESEIDTLMTLLGKIRSNLCESCCCRKEDKNKK